jgi:hypothetical protein
MLATRLLLHFPIWIRELQLFGPISIKLYKQVWKVNCRKYIKLPKPDCLLRVIFIHFRRIFYWPLQRALENNGKQTKKTTVIVLNLEKLDKENVEWDWAHRKKEVRCNIISMLKWGWVVSEKPILYVTASPMILKVDSLNKCQCTHIK